MIPLAWLAASLSAAPAPALPPAPKTADTLDACAGIRALENPAAPRHIRREWMWKCLENALTPAAQSWLNGLNETERLGLASQSLDLGLMQAAEKTFPANGSPRLRHVREILHARLEAGQGNWRAADARLQAWKNSAERREGSGEVLFWQGWSALHQRRAAEADSLFMLASAYVDEPACRKALEYRYAGLLDSGASLAAYMRGLPESPRPDSVRLASLKKVPESSPLRPHALWETLVVLEHSLPPANAEAVGVLEVLARDPSTIPGRRAVALLAFAQEARRPDSALAAYERLLLEYQQGVSAEFARSRIQNLRSRTQSP